jgi:hypothetical protein
MTLIQEPKDFDQYVKRVRPEQLEELITIKFGAPPRFKTIDIKNNLDSSLKSQGLQNQD